MASDDQDPQSRNGAAGEDGLEAQNRAAINGLPAVPKPPIPRGLPAAPALFVDRSEEQTELNRVFTGDGTAPAVTISGRRGVGSSSLVRHWGHRDGERLYPDGTLYADLRESRAHGGTAVAAVLAAFLKACGCDVPGEFDSRLERFRSYLRGKRILVVLDHVEHEADVRALRPSSAGSALITTSDHRGEYTDGHRNVPLNPLDEVAAGDLMRKALEEAGRAAEPDSDIDELVKLCDRVPKLLCMAADRMGRDHNVSLSDVIAWLRAERDREGASIPDIVVGGAYEALSPQAEQVYRMLGYHPGLDMHKEAIHALAEMTGGIGLNVITELCDRYLLEYHSADRYQMASLVQAHARAQARVVDGDDAEGRALVAWGHWYVGCAQAADRAFIPDRNRVFPLEAPAPKSFADDQQAMAWLDAERHNLLAMQRRLFALDRFRPVMQLGEAMWVMYIGALYLEDWLESSRLSLQAALASGHHKGQLRFHAFLGRALMENAPNVPEPSRMYAEAGHELDRARELPIVDAGDLDLRASAIEFKGRLLGYLSRHREAIDCYREALELFAQRAADSDAPEHERAANRRGVALQYQFIGVSLLKLDDYAAAAGNLRQAEARLLETSHYRDVAKVRTLIGEALRLAGRIYDAHEVLTQAVNALTGKTWFRVEADALWQLSFVAKARELAELERDCLQRLRERYAVTHNPRLAEVDERLAALPQ